MTHNTPAPVADQALAERLARRASVWDSTKRDTDATSNQVLKARALFIDDIEQAYRSGQLITLAEAQAMVAWEAAAVIVEINMLCGDSDGSEVLHPRTNPGNKTGLAYAAAIRAAATGTKEGM